jgi:mannose-6-phosphate isomerase-like protein (cupin superfamily)
MSTGRTTVVRGEGEGRRLGVVGDAYRFLATGDDTQGRYALWEAVVLPGGGPPLHVHSREDEGFFVLEGEITFQVEERTLAVGAGTFVNLPPRVRHRFENRSQSPARMLILVAPAGLEKMFEETGVPLEAGTLAGPPTAEEIARIVEAAPRYGVTIFPPKHP